MQSILKKYEDEKMLYVVPSGADDDWYWMYATVFEGRSKPAFVVTNDLMRDHRLAFMEPRPFIRWRSTHIINFDINKFNDTVSLSKRIIYLF
jgi:proteinaceous RNase P